MSQINVVAIGDDGDATQLTQLSINPVTAHLVPTHYGLLKPGDWIGQTIGNGAFGRSGKIVFTFDGADK